LKNSTPKSSNPSEKTPNSLNKPLNKTQIESRLPRESKDSREEEEEPTPKKESILLLKKLPRLPPRKSDETS
jgi:hypothetical protein